jgi:hypothetical protein
MKWQASPDQTSPARFRIEEPVVPGKRTRVDPVGEAELRAIRSERIQSPKGRGSEAPIEPHHDSALSGALHGRDPFVVAGPERERLLDEHRLVGAQCCLDPARVRVVAGRDEHDLGPWIVDRELAVGGRGAEPPRFRACSALSGV